MEIRSKSDITNVLKKHKYGSIESDKKASNGWSYVPYRDYDNKLVKGISLFRTSPVTFTDSGRKNGVEKVDRLIDDMRSLGEVKRLSEFGFVAVVLTGKNKCVKVIGSLDSREGILYDQTFHFLNINMTEQKLSQTDIASHKTYEDAKTDIYEITPEYLDRILNRQS